MLFTQFGWFDVSMMAGLVQVSMTLLAMSHLKTKPNVKMRYYSTLLSISKKTATQEAVRVEQSRRKKKYVRRKSFGSSYIFLFSFSSWKFYPFFFHSCAHHKSTLESEKRSISQCLLSKYHKLSRVRYAKRFAPPSP